MIQSAFAAFLIWSLTIIVGGAITPTQAYAKSIKLEALPVQDAGRIKPFDTFARETLQLIWGREKFQNKKAVDVVFSWMLVPEQLENEKLILIRHAGLREALQLENKRLHYSVGELMTNARLGLLIQDLQGIRDATKKGSTEKMDPFFQAVQTLESQITFFQAIRMGLAPGLVPVVATEPVDPLAPPNKWLNPSQLKDAHKEQFANITKSFIRYIAAKNEKTEVPAEPMPSVEEAVGAFVGGVEAVHGDYSQAGKISAEVLYNRLHPFMISWISYLIAAILFAFALFGEPKKYLTYAWVAVAIGFVFHLAGFAARIYITGHAPVTNMYETVVWVALGNIVIAAIFYRYWKNIVLMLAATSASTLCLILCDISNHVLDGSLNPLEPVLRDNFWLTTHVLTITLSYAAFFLAFFVGDITLFYYLKDEKKYADKIAQAANAMYRSIQVGVVLLSAGVILGGIWADYSWGRFWGWDPK